MRVAKKENIRVEVEPYDYSAGTYVDDIVQTCEAIKDQIKRHVDDVAYIHVMYDTNYYCSHCGYGWETITDPKDDDGPVGLPVCCQKAIEEFAAEIFKDWPVSEGVQ